MVIIKKIILILLVCVFMLLLAYFFLGLNSKPEIDKASVKEKALINYPKEFNYRQSKNDCGPFNVAATIRALTNKDVKSALFADEISWRLPNNYTLPWGLEKQLKKNKIRTLKPNFRKLSDDEKILLIQQYLSLGSPIIILGERNNYEHYITILGFDSSLDQYYVYDSLQSFLPEKKDITIDENSDFPGNKSMKSQEILDFWRGGGMYGLWEWYGLVASK